jgi:hypothetical protein
MRWRGVDGTIRIAMIMHGGKLTIDALMLDIAIGALCSAYEYLGGD